MVICIQELASQDEEMEIFEILELADGLMGTSQEAPSQNRKNHET